jgi:hypothetical protein
VETIRGNTVFIMISFSTGKLRKNCLGPIRSLFSFSTTQTEKKSSLFGGLIPWARYLKLCGFLIAESKKPSKILSNENIKTGVSRKIVCFGILIHILSWRH